jgi:hypothetical protein
MSCWLHAADTVTKSYSALAVDQPVSFQFPQICSVFFEQLIYYSGLLGRIALTLQARTHA